MKEFKDKVAVITGAASGIGRSLAERCVAEGMKIVLADINKEVLEKTEQELKAKGGLVLSMVTDVSKAGDVELLGQKTMDAFGAVHLLCNNAGVVTLKSIGGEPVWESSLTDWAWVIGVNLWGVIHGIHVFVPIMLKQRNECHIVNTASIAGLIANPNLGTSYTVTKHGVVALSELLHHQLVQKRSQIKVSVLCPGFVNTQILEAARNRPVELGGDSTGWDKSRSEAQILQALRQPLLASMPADEVAASVFDAIQEESFYILTHPGTKYSLQIRMEDILKNHTPTVPVSIHSESFAQFIG